jgi:hypothetical protein
MNHMDSRILKALNVITILFAVLAGAFFALSPTFIMARGSVFIGLFPFAICFIISYAISLIVQKKLSHALILPSVYTFTFGGYMGIALFISASLSFERGFEITTFHLVWLVISIISCLVPKLTVHLTSR